MELYEINPHVRYAVVHKSSFRARREISVCYDARVFYFEDVEGSITVNGEKHRITNKTAIYMPPLSRYIFNIKPSANSVVYVVNFDLTAEFSYLKFSLGTAVLSNFNPDIAPRYSLPTEFSAPIVRALPNISDSMANLISIYLKESRFSAERLSALMKLVLIEFIDTENVLRSPLCESVIDFIEKNFADCSITNESIATSLSYHPYYVNRVFKRELGISLRAYIIDYRLSVARGMLVSTRYNVSEVAFRTGFSSSAYFVKMFKSKYGLTPKEYRTSRLSPVL
jgi:AraC-like DNA-binding protein